MGSAPSQPAAPPKKGTKKKHKSKKKVQAEAEVGEAEAFTNQETEDAQNEQATNQALDEADVNNEDEEQASAAGPMKLRKEKSVVLNDKYVQLMRMFAQDPPPWYMTGDDIPDFDEYTRIGEGSVAVVWKGMLRGKEVALKMLKVVEDERESPTSLKPACADFSEELKVVSVGLDHPNIEQFVGAGLMDYQNQTFPMIVYEYLAGGSVEDFVVGQKDELGEKWRAPRSQSYSWCAQLWSALHFLHTLDSPLGHRDVKPANCLLTSDHRTLKLADFSLAVPLRGTFANFASAPSVAGSLRYMAPEVTENAPVQLEKADVYSAAVTCWFMVQCEVPFGEHGSYMAHQLAKQGIRPPLSDARLSAALSSAWSFFPVERPPAADMQEAFEAMLAPLLAKADKEQLSSAG